VPQAAGAAGPIGQVTVLPWTGDGADVDPRGGRRGLATLGVVLDAALLDLTADRREKVGAR
jgi:hypothetical protein